MTKIWNEAGFVSDDPWVIETDQIKADGNEQPLLSIDECLEQVANGAQGSLGVLVRPDDVVNRLGDCLDRIALVAISFPAFSDGRGYSHASILRDQMGFEGEIRAVGDVLIDQVPLMLRCGFDSFAVTNETALRRLADNRLPGISRHYQPAALGSTATGSYSWRRVSAAKA